MKTKLSVVMLLLFMLVFSSGCWNRIEPENLLIVLAIGFERVEDSSEIRVIVQAANPGAMEQEGPEGNGGSGGGSSVWVADAVGRTAFEAMNNINIKSTRQRDFTHTIVVVFCEALAREGIADILDYLDRDRQIRAIVRPLVLEGDLRKALEAEFPLQETGARAIINHLTVTQEQLSTTVDVKLNRMFNRLSQPGWELVLPRLELMEGENGELSRENPLAVNGLAAFKKDRMVGWLNEQESRGLNWLTNNIDRVTYVLSSPARNEKELSVEIYESSVSLEAVVEDGRVKITIDIRADGRLQETTDREQWFATDTELTDSLDRRLAQAIRNNLEEVIQAAQQDLQTDILSFGNLINRTLPREWDKLASRWDDIFPDVQVEIRVDANVRRTGLIKNPLQIR